MADTITRDARSRNMAAIKSKNTSDEVYFRKLLFHKGYRYSLHSTKVPGHPDLYLAKYNSAIYINGCFWHRHKNCKYAYTPKSRVEFWQQKFENNQNRDMVVAQQLRNLEIKQLIIWECTIKKMMKNSDFEKEVLNQVEAFLNNSEQIVEI